MEEREVGEVKEAGLNGRNLSIAAVLLLVLWLVGAHSGIRAAVATLKAAPDILSATRDEKRLSIDGPFYHLVNEAQSLISDGDRVLFLRPGDGQKTNIYARRLMYYLYPTVIADATSVGSIKPDDNFAYEYIFFMNPPGSGAVVADKYLLGFSSLSKVYERMDAGGYLAIYRVRGGQGQ